MNPADCPIAKRPVVVYFHRYPIEDESDQFPATQLLIELLSKNFEVVYFSMGGFRTDESLRLNCRCEEIPLRVNWANSRDKWTKTILYYFYLPFALRRLRRLNPAFIICKETLPFIPSLIIRLRKPTLIDVGDWWLSILFGKMRVGRKLADFVEKWQVADWNRFNVVVGTRTMAESDLMEKMGISRDKVRLINASQHQGAYFPVSAVVERKKLGFEKDDWVVAVHGIIHPSKGYGQILEWWSEIVKARPNWKLLIIGGSGEEEQCRRQIASLKIEKNVVMAGWLPSHADVNLALNASDCLLVTRRNSSENQGVIPSALFHSLALNKPTVVTGLPGMCEVVKDKVNGFVFEPDNFESFKATLEYVCDHKVEAEAAAVRGVQTAKESFDLNTCAEKYFELINGAVQDCHHSSCRPSPGGRRTSPEVSTKFQYDRTFYETNAKYLAALEQHEHDPAWFKDYYGAVLRHSDARAKILDCGCGTGVTTAWLHQHRPNIRGVDFSSTFVETARKRGDYFAVMDLKAIQYPDHQFDLVCSADAIEHIPDLPLAISEMLRILKPGGVIVLQAPNLSTSIISTNYFVTFRNVVRKLRFWWQDLWCPRLRTIEEFELDVKTGDRDAYNLISPLWLRHHLRRGGCEVLSLTTYAVYFRPSLPARVVLACLSVLPIARHFGGRIVLVARKPARA